MLYNFEYLVPKHQLGQFPHQSWVDAHFLETHRAFRLWEYSAYVAPIDIPMRFFLSFLTGYITPMRVCRSQCQR